jgi:hypothetical protein
MKVKTLLAKAARCKTAADVDSFSHVMRDAFGRSGPLSHLPEANDEAYMEEDKPFVRFELNREISDHYITMIRPEVRNGELVVVVTTNHMLDGLGMQSQNWEVVEGMEEVIEAQPEWTVAALARLAADCAIADHRELLERLGVPHQVAKQAAKKSW